MKQFNWGKKQIDQKGRETIYFEQQFITGGRDISQLPERYKMVTRFLFVGFGKKYPLNWKIDKIPKGKFMIPLYPPNKSRQHVSLGLLIGIRENYIKLCRELHLELEVASSTLKIKIKDLVKLDQHPKKNLIGFEVQSYCQVYSGDFFKILSKFISSRSKDNYGSSYLPHITYAQTIQGFEEDVIEYLDVNYRESFQAVKFDGFTLNKCYKENS